MPFSQREDVRGAIEALGLEHLVLVGMSMGGLNTMAYASRYPRRLLAVCIVDVGPTIQRSGFEDTGRFLTDKREFASLDEALEHARQFNPRRPPTHLRYSLMHALKQTEQGTWTWSYAGQASRPMTPEERTAQADKVLATYAKLWDWVPRIPCPALVVQGGASNVLTRADAEKLAAAMPQGRAITIPRAGHTVQGDRPKQFASALRKFLREVL
jgi:pimeloyl-ACP methyl ester carboxylesterase